MNPILLSDIPGLDEAVRRAAVRESEIRRQPFFPLPIVIAGVQLLPMTLRHYSFLEAVRSPFLVGDLGTLGDVLQFLWILSPENVYPTAWLSLAAVKKARKAFMERIRARAGRYKLGSVCRKIRQLVEEALFECPKPRRGGKAEIPRVYLAASLIDEFAGEYGFPDEVLDERGQPDRRQPGIFDMPLGRLFQYRRAYTMRRFPGTELPNPLSDGAEARFLREYNARAKARAAKKGAR